MDDARAGTQAHEQGVPNAVGASQARRPSTAIVCLSDMATRRSLLPCFLALLTACRQPPPSAQPPHAAPPPLPAPVVAQPIPPDVAPPPPPAPKPPLPLDERLAADIGQGGAVLLDIRDDGVWAKSLDGARKERLVPNDATWLWPDAQARVLWLWREDGGELRALDLATPLPEPVTIATAVPTGLAWHWPKRAMLGPDDARLRLSLDPHDAGFQYSLPPQPGKWNAPLRWKTCGTGKDKQAEAACPKLGPVAQPLLKSWGLRAEGVPNAARLGRASPQPQGCTSATCGEAHTLPVGHWWLVPATVWSDCCRRGHQLYDPRSKKFLRLGSGKLLPAPSGDRRDTMEFLWLCPHGDAIVTESGVVPLEPPGPLQFGAADACLGGLPLRTPSLPCPQGDQCEEEVAEPPAGDPD